MAVRKSVENRLRRAAERQGWELIKSRARHPSHFRFGLYRLVGHPQFGDTWITIWRAAELIGEPITVEDDEL